MKKLLVSIIAVLVLCAAAVFAADYFGTTKYGTYYQYPYYNAYQSYYEYPTYGYNTAAGSDYRYSATDYYPERYYYQAAPYEYTRYLYRYGTTGVSPTVIEHPSYTSFYTKVSSNAQEGQLCGMLLNKFYDCAPGLYCSIKDKYIGLCEKPTA